MLWYRCRCQWCRPRHRIFGGVSRCRYQSYGIDTGGNPPNLAGTREIQGNLARFCRYRNPTRHKSLNYGSIPQSLTKMAKNVTQKRTLVANYTFALVSSTFLTPCFDTGVMTLVSTPGPVSVSRRFAGAGVGADTEKQRCQASLKIWICLLCLHFIASADSSKVLSWRFSNMSLSTISGFHFAPTRVGRGRAALAAIRVLDPSHEAWRHQPSRTAGPEAAAAPGQRNWHLSSPKGAIRPVLWWTHQTVYHKLHWKGSAFTKGRNQRYFYLNISLIFKCSRSEMN